MTEPRNGRPRTPSVAELQAALLAAERSDFTTDSPGSSPGISQMPAHRSVDLEAARVPQRRGRRQTRHPIPAQPPAAQEAAVTLLGTHGGSGAGCLSALLPRADLGEKGWSCAGIHPVVLVCRSSHRGLTSAQDHAREHRDGDCGRNVPLLGAVVVAASPGRVPTPLRRLEQLLSGALPVLGHVPWMDAWRLGPARPLEQQPAWLTNLSASINAAQHTAASRRPA
jgi:hypothetical protein